MIKVTRLNGKEYYINAEMIVNIEATPDTVITTVEGTKVVVKETCESIVNEIIEYKRKIYKDLLSIDLKTSD